MPRLTSSLFLALSGAISGSLSCEIPDTPLSNNITQMFSIFVQNPAIPIVHNRIMNFRANGDDEHLVLRPEGVQTYDRLYLDNGLLRVRNIHGVIDLEYDDRDDTTKLFMTERLYHPSALFQPVYGCDPDTDELQIRLQLVSRQTTPPVLGGQIGIREVVGTYEFRYSPPNNPLLTPSFMPVNMVIFRDGLTPPTPTTTTSTTTSAGPAPTPPTLDDYEFVSCWAEPDGGRTLGTVFTAADMTNQKCASLCAGSQYIGTQWSVECFCGATLAGGAAAPAADCSYTCSGDSSQTCGGARRLSLYRKRSGSASSSTTTTTALTTSATTSSATISSTTTTSTTTTTTTTTTSATTSSLTTPSPGTLPPVGAYNFVSCWAEPPSGRALTAGFTGTDDMTLEKCAATCSAYAYFGTEWGRECFCGNTLADGSGPAPLSDCSYACTGSASQKCGGSRRLSLYHNDAYTGPTQPAKVGNFDLLGCYTDSTSSRTLTGSLLRSSVLTLERCATFCSGFQYFGTEYSAECFCGNTLTAGTAQVALSQCSMTCSGDNKQYCGNGDRLSLYKVAAP